MSEARTEFGVALDAVRSSLQKALRRGDEYEAFYWTMTLCVYGWSRYAWRVLQQCAVEDVGAGAPDCIVRVNALAQAATDITQGFKQMAHSGLAEAPACQVIARAKKNWHGVHLLLRVKQELMHRRRGIVPPRQPRLEFLDSHTAEGRKAGRSRAEFYAEGDALAPRAPDHHLNGPGLDPPRRHQRRRKVLDE